MLPDGSPVFPLEERSDKRVMAKLETLIDSAFASPAQLTTEETVATLADELTGRIWRALSQMVAGFSFEDSRNSSDKSGATKNLLRPDYCVWVNKALVFKAEHKAEGDELHTALDELVTKMLGGWNPVAMRGLPFLPCFAAGGTFLQFAIVSPGPGATAHVQSVSDPISMITPVGRLHILRVAFKMFRLLVWLSGKITPGTLRLYKKQLRGDRGESVMITPDHVVKRAFVTAPADLYARLATASIPSAVSVDSFERVDDGLSKLVSRPVGIERLPVSEDELRSALTCALRALGALHGYGFVHRDVRWPNLLSDGASGWLLADFESAGVAGHPLPAGLISSWRLSPETRLPGAGYEPKDDVWQVGNLLATCGLTLSPAAEAFRAALMTTRSSRPDVAGARLILW